MTRRQPGPGSHAARAALGTLILVGGLCLLGGGHPRGGGRVTIYLESTEEGRALEEAIGNRISSRHAARADGRGSLVRVTSGSDTSRVWTLAVGSPALGGSTGDIAIALLEAAHSPRDDSLGVWTDLLSGRFPLGEPAETFQLDFDRGVPDPSLRFALWELPATERWADRVGSLRGADGRGTFRRIDPALWPAWLSEISLVHTSIVPEPARGEITVSPWRTGEPPWGEPVAGSRVGDTAEDVDPRSRIASDPIIVLWALRIVEPTGAAIDSSARAWLRLALDGSAFAPLVPAGVIPDPGWIIGSSAGGIGDPASSTGDPPPSLALNGVCLPGAGGERSESLRRRIRVILSGADVPVFAYGSGPPDAIHLRLERHVAFGMDPVVDLVLGGAAGSLPGSNPAWVVLPVAHRVRYGPDVMGDLAAPDGLWLASPRANP